MKVRIHYSNDHEYMISDQDISVKLISKTIIVHLLCWTGYIAFELFALHYFAGKLEPAYRYVCYYILNIGFCYAILWAISYSRRPKKQELLSNIFSWAAVIGGYIGLKLIANYAFYAAQAPFPEQFRDFHKFLITTLYRGSFFALIALFYWIAGHLSAYKRQALEAEKLQLAALRDKAVMEKELAESQNAFLQQQLNPHLLFNALSFVYSQVFRHSADGAKAIQLLTDILRYTIRNTGPDGKTGLISEIGQIKNLIEINRYRFDTPLELDAKFEGNFDQYRMIPLILLTLTENIFKHGHLRDPDHRASLTIRVSDDSQLLYHSRNLKKAESGHARLHSIGLKNIRIRLDNAYSGRYELDIRDAGLSYELILKVTL